MKLKELEPILYSDLCNVQHVIVWDSKKRKDWDRTPSVEYLIENHPELEILRIQAYNNFLVFTV